jgi:hypothetical protein
MPTNLFADNHPSAFEGIVVLLMAVLVGLFCAPTASIAREYRNGFTTDPSFFPIGVWSQSPDHAPEYKAIGINTYVGLWKGPTEQQLATLAKYNMNVVASQNETALHSANRSVIKAWLHVDEPDNAQPIGMGLHGSCIPAAEVVRRTEQMKSNDPTRPVMITFGQGIANPYWNGRGPCTGDENYYSIASQAIDILSFDIYPVGSTTPQVKGKLEYVARGVSRLMTLTKDGQKVWTALETTALDPGHAVTAAELRAELWMAIINGARGIVYFVHEFSPIFREDAIFRHPTIVSEVTKEDALIKSLASVLNSPSLQGAISVKSTAPMATMVKSTNNALYIFSVAMSDSPSQPEFTLKQSRAENAAVIGENRQVTFSGTSFRDSFSGYDVHIYRILRSEAGTRPVP